MQNHTQITIEQLEQLAAQIESEETAERARLHRLICAYARIIAVREPDAFRRRAVEYSDTDGHWDNTYPPEIKYKDFSGPELFRVAKFDWDEIATSGGFYHDWRAATSDRGLYVTRDGDLYGAEVSGSGSYGKFAAHPGNCGVMLSIDWVEQDLAEITMARLQEAERVLREQAFPLVAAALAHA